VTAILFGLFYLGAKPYAADLFPVPWDKLAHLGVFGALAAALWFAFSGRRPITSLVLAITFGVLDESHQLMLPGRSADIWDLAADALAASMVIAWLYYSREKIASSRQPCAGAICHAMLDRVKR
jgi:VanZ family protein